MHNVFSVIKTKIILIWYMLVTNLHFSSSTLNFNLADLINFFKELCKFFLLITVAMLPKTTPIFGTITK